MSIKHPIARRALEQLPPAVRSLINDEDMIAAAWLLLAEQPGLSLDKLASKLNAIRMNAARAGGKAGPGVCVRLDDDNCVCDIAAEQDDEFERWRTAILSPDREKMLDALRDGTDTLAKQSRVARRTAQSRVKKMIALAAMQQALF